MERACSSPTRFADMMAKRKAVFIDQPEPKAQRARKTGPPTPGRDSMLGHWRLWSQCPPEKRINQPLAPYSSVLRVCCNEIAATYILKVEGVRPASRETPQSWPPYKRWYPPPACTPDKEAPPLELILEAGGWRISMQDGAPDRLSREWVGPCSVQTDVTVSQ